MTNASYLTPAGLEQLQAELHLLKTVEREALSKRLRSAIQMGDLSENADYHKAKEDQAFLEGRIKDLENTLKNVILIEEGKVGSGKVVIGSRITVQIDGNEPKTWFLVGSKEANPRDGKISHDSPIGKALLDHVKGDVVEVITPAGKISIKLLEIK
jgi:transcription elongation factor GreA